MDEIVHPALTIIVTGNQWYWSYEYSDYSNEAIAFDSYMIPEDELEQGQLRLLEVDNRVVLPVDTHVRILVTARDVIHCWSVPSLGVKCDGIPGRLNQTSVFADREGSFYGQCSEICGAHHGYMPICVESVSLPDYFNWISSQLPAEQTEMLDSDVSNSSEGSSQGGTKVDFLPQSTILEESTSVGVDIDNNSSIQRDLKNLHIKLESHDKMIGYLCANHEDLQDQLDLQNKEVDNILKELKKAQTK